MKQPKKSALILICTLAVVSITSATHVGAHPEAYYSAHICQPVDRYGVPTKGISYIYGGAYNMDEDTTLWLVCPVPYVRDTNDLSTVRVRLRAEDRHSQQGVRLHICETHDDASPSSGVCPIEAQAHSGNAFALGSVLVEAAFNPGPETRWIFLNIEVPDMDTQTGKSGIIGYRVCRGNC